MISPSKLLARFASAAAFALLASCGPSQAVAQHRELTASVLQRTGAPDFADASTDDHPAIRHEPSGLTCRLPRNGAFDFGTFPAAAANPGAQCTTASEQVATSFIVVAFPQTNLDDAFARALAETAGRAGATPWEGEPSAADAASPEGLPHFRLARFTASADGQQIYLRIGMTEAGGWYLQHIVYAPVADAHAVEAAAGQEWRAALADFAAAPRRSP